MGNLLFMSPGAKPLRSRALNVDAALIFGPDLMAVAPTLPPPIRAAAEASPELARVRENPATTQLRAIDPLTEARVLRQLSDAYPDACIVASIHRLSAMPHFDTVLYMDEGRLVDQGSYGEVLSRQPGLRALAAQDLRAQAG